MRAVVIEGAFGLAQLQVVHRPEPRCGPGQALLRMKAASLNYRDLLTVLGHYNPKQPLPLIPCSDGAGEVVAVGAGVDRVAVGDLVAPIFCQGWISGPPTRARLRNTVGGPLDGTLAELMVVDAEGLVHLPEHLDPTEGACLPCAAVTAWSALVKEGEVKAGDTVLVQGSGGVSLFALQLAKALGARVIATSSSAEKLARLEAMGADALINYREQPQWGPLARKLAGGEGIDHVVEVGGAQTLEQTLRAVRVGGRVSLIGVLSGAAARLNLVPILMQQVRLQGILVGCRDDFEQMNRTLAAHRIRPVLDEQPFGLDQTRPAFERMQNGKHFGKITIKFD